METQPVIVIRRIVKHVAQRLQRPFALMLLSRRRRGTIIKNISFTVLVIRSQTAWVGLLTTQRKLVTVVVLYLG